MQLHEDQGTAPPAASSGRSSDLAERGGATPMSSRSDSSGRSLLHGWHRPRARGRSRPDAHRRRPTHRHCEARKHEIGASPKSWSAPIPDLHGDAWRSRRGRRSGSLGHDRRSRKDNRGLSVANLQHGATIARNLDLLEAAPPLDAQGLKRAAVCLIVAENGAGEAALVLTRRAQHLSAHAGQFAFPGGRVDAGESAAEAALREAREEIGLALAPASILGRLTTTRRAPATSSRRWSPGRRARR